MQRLAESIQIQHDGQSVEVERVIKDIRSTEKGNTVLLLGGVHGNEPLGILAIEKVLSTVVENGMKTKGRILALVGNMEASKITQRYLYKDLNRLWTRDNIDDLHYNRLNLLHTEYREMKDLYDQLQDAIKELDEDLYVVDLHTTSGPTIPFIVTNKLEKCREFTEKFPMPAISGLTGFLDGTFLSYINELGHIGLAYEAGQHKSPQSYTRFESFIWLTLIHTGVLVDVEESFIEFHTQALIEELTTRTRSFKIISRYRIHDGEEFKMEPGFTNFQRIHKDEILAHNINGPVLSPYDGYIFMPLYQKLGDDGFFIIKPEED